MVAMGERGIVPPSSDNDLPSNRNNPILLPLPPNPQR